MIILKYYLDLPAYSHDYLFEIKKAVIHIFFVSNYLFQSHSEKRKKFFFRFLSRFGEKMKDTPSESFNFFTNFSLANFTSS